MEALSAHTSLRVGGPANNFVKAANEAEELKIELEKEQHNIKERVVTEWGNGDADLA